MSVKISSSQAKGVRMRLDDLEKKASKREGMVSARTLVLDNRDIIKRLRSLDCSWQEIAGVISTDSIALKEGTIRAYMRDLPNSSEKLPKQDEKQPAKSTASAAGETVEPGAAGLESTPAVVPPPAEPEADMVMAGAPESVVPPLAESVSEASDTADWRQSFDETDTDDRPLPPSSPAMDALSRAGATVTELAGPQMMAEQATITIPPAEMDKARVAGVERAADLLEAGTGLPEIIRDLEGGGFDRLPIDLLFRALEKEIGREAADKRIKAELPLDQLLSKVS